MVARDNYEIDIFTGVRKALKTKDGKRHELYRHYDRDGVLLYVGISLNAISRLADHKRQASWYDFVETVKIERFASRRQLERAEREAIVKEAPLFNGHLAPS